MILIALTTWLALFSLLGEVLATSPWSIRTCALLICIAAGAAWPGLCVANATVGFVILVLARDPVRAVFPGLQPDDPAWSPILPSVIAVTVRREDMAAVLPPLRRLLDGLDATPSRGRFTLHVLSDTPDGPEAEAEAAAMEAFRAADRAPARIHYRRRRSNDGFKAGNLMAFLDTAPEALAPEVLAPEALAPEALAPEALALVLDADSKMSATAARRLLRALEDDPSLGLVQHLTVGTPAGAALPRLFQFGMRAGMRVWAVGQAWWQDDEGPYWGHNAALRVAPFRDHARLAKLPDGSDILSHDQVEAAQLRGAGWGVRVLPAEDGSQEDNPPALPEFIRRDLRWMAGNLQYVSLLGQPGLRPMGRWQFLQAIGLFASAPFHTLGLALAALGVAAGDTYSAWRVAGATAAWLGALYSPKLLGYAQVLIAPRERARYGGAARFAVAVAVEIVFTLLLDSIMGVGKTLGMVRRVLGAQAAWLPQNRADRGVTWPEAARLLWPHTLFGAFVVAACLPGGWGAVLWALVFAGGALAAIPFCVCTSNPRLGGWLARRGVAAVPEEIVL